MVNFLGRKIFFLVTWPVTWPVTRPVTWPVICDLCFRPAGGVQTFGPGCSWFSENGNYNSLSWDPERNMMECSLVVILFGVNAGNVINTRREVVEAVLLMLFKSLISCVQPEASWSEGAFPRLFYFLAWSLFFTDGKYKGIWSLRESVIFEPCKCMLSCIFTVVTLSRSKMESPSRTIKSWSFIHITSAH